MPDSLWQSDMFVPWNLRGVASSAFSDSRFFFFLMKLLKVPVMQSKWRGKQSDLISPCWCAVGCFAFRTGTLFTHRTNCSVKENYFVSAHCCKSVRGKKTQKTVPHTTASKCSLITLLGQYWFYTLSRVPWGKLVLLQCFAVLAV